MLFPRISAPPLWDLSDPPPPTPGPRAVPSALSRGPSCVAGLGVGQLAPSPHRGNLLAFEVPSMAPWDPGAGKCLRDWITGPGADPCPPKQRYPRLSRHGFGGGVGFGPSQRGGGAQASLWDSPRAKGPSACAVRALRRAAKVAGINAQF